MSYDKFLIHQNGKIISTVEIPANLPIMEMKGTLYTDRDLPNYNQMEILQVGPNSYLGPSGDVDDHIRHSCDPNCYLHVVGNRAILYSLYVIQPKTELTFDYSTTSTNSPNEWSMNCKCASNKCRKIISGFQYLDSKLQEEYKRKKMIPLYLTSSMITKR